MYHTDSPAVATAIGICAGCAGFCFVLFVGKLGRRRRLDPLESVLTPYRRGDYEAALEATEGLRESMAALSPQLPLSQAEIDRHYWALRGGALMQLGELSEAEKSLDQAVALAQQCECEYRRWDPGMERKIKLSALHSARLGEIYLQQRRYDDAMKRFEASLRDWPSHGPFHAHMAEACLLKGDPPSEGLKWATLAVDEDRAAKASPETHDMNLCEDLATLAWAVAVASPNRAQVDGLIAEAVKLAGTRSVPTSAQVHFQAALAYIALGDWERSTRYLEEASHIDPQGRWGRAARAQAAELARSLPSSPLTAFPPRVSP
jgi:tetratricopeptide (TPR) repeat protein